MEEEEKEQQAEEDEEGTCLEDLLQSSDANLDSVLKRASEAVDDSQVGEDARRDEQVEDRRLGSLGAQLVLRHSPQGEVDPRHRLHRDLNRYVSLRLYNSLSTRIMSFSWG